MAGLRWKYMLSLPAVLLVRLPIGYHFLKPYQKDRLASFVYPDRDPKGTGFQVIQSRIAVGNGGMWGRGQGELADSPAVFCRCRIPTSSFPPSPRNTGSWESLIALVLYFLLIMQVVQNAQTATDRAGSVYLHGRCGIAVVSRAGECRDGGGQDAGHGNSLPLMSSGGSNTWSIFLMLGLVNSVRLRRFVN